MPFGLLLLRAFVGLLLAAHGSQKLFGAFKGPGVSGTGAYFEELGLRPGRFFAVTAGLGELGGGLMLAFGLLTPLGSALIIAVMVTAVGTVHRGKGLFAQNGGYELPVLIAVACAAISFTGPGAYSLDAVLGTYAAGADAGIFSVVVGLIGGGIALGARAAAQSREERRVEI